MTGPRLGPRTHNARAPARHSSHSDETTRLYNALQQFFRTSPNPRNIAVRRVLRLPQSFSIVAEFHDAQLVSALSAARKTAQVAAPRRSSAAGRDGRIAPPFPARAEGAIRLGGYHIDGCPLPRPRGGSPQAAKAWRRSRFLVRAQKERNTSLPACGVQSFSAKAWRKKAPELLSPVRAKERTAGNRLKANFGGFPLCARKKIGTESGLIRPRRLCPGHSPRAGTSGVRGATRCRKTTPSGAL